MVLHAMCIGDKRREEGNELNINQYPVDTALIDTYLKQSEPKHCTCIKHEKCIFQQKKKGILPSEKPPKWRTGISTSPCTLTSSSPGVPLWAPPIAPGCKGMTDRGPTSIQTQNCNPQFHLFKARQQLSYLSKLASWGRLFCSALCWYGLTSSHSFGQHNIRRIEKNETMSKEGLQR